MIPSFFRTLTFRYALLGAVLLWSAFPPVDLWPLAWIAPLPWILLIRRKKLDGDRPYRILTLVGFVFWMATLHWLRLPHWTTNFGWVALSFYFAFYLPVFIGLSRTTVHQLHIPVILAAPIVWTGLELARAHLLTGMTMASLAHTQYRWVELIQLSDLTGAYGVSFLVMFVAVCLGRMLPSENKPHAYWPLLPALALLAVALGYGYVRTAKDATAPSAKIALIQGSIDTQFGYDEHLRGTIFQHYFELSRQALKQFGAVDLIVWPETFFLYPLIICDEDAGRYNTEVRGSGITAEEFQRRLQLLADNSRYALADTAKELGAPLLLGLDTQHYTSSGVDIFNSAVHVAASGEVLGRYDKMHLVMFGEYIPFADYLPWLYRPDARSKCR